MKRIAISLICLLVTSCSPKIGPRNVKDDSVKYNEAVKTGFDRQLLMNIVRLRYRDTPAFLEVGIVSSSYDFKRSISSQFETGNVDFPTVGWKPSIGMDYSEKPTTTYQPLTGKLFVDRLLSPIRFDTFILLNSSGWNIDRLMRCCVQRMNNIKNAPRASGPTPSTIPDYEDFLELATLIQNLEVNDALHFMKKQDADTKDPYYLMTVDPDVADLNVMNRLWTLLELDPGTYQFYLTRFSGKKHRGNEIAIETRSPLGVLYFLSHGVNVPFHDEISGRVTMTLEPNGEVFDWNNVLNDLMSIHNVPIARKSRNLPCYGIAVCYRGNIFYIDDSDLASKSTFNLISQLMALQTGCPDLPLLTLPIVQ